MSEMFIKIGFADWQFYPLFLSIYLVAIFLSSGINGLNPVSYILIGVCIGATFFRFVEDYFDWYTKKSKEVKKKNE